MNNGNNKSRFFSLVSYHDTEIINYILNKNADKIYKYAYINAYRDIDLEKGGIKQAHHHILIRTYNTYTVKSIRNWFKLPNNPTNTLGQVVSSGDDIKDYLLHIKCPEKGLYSVNEIVSNDWQWFCKSVDNTPAQCLFEDVLNGLDYHTLVKKYGREYIINFRKYHELAYYIKHNKKFEFE